MEASKSDDSGLNLLKSPAPRRRRRLLCVHPSGSERSFGCTAHLASSGLCEAPGRDRTLGQGFVGDTNGVSAMNEIPRARLESASIEG